MFGVLMIFFLLWVLVAGLIWARRVEFYLVDHVRVLFSQGAPPKEGLRAPGQLDGVNPVRSGAFVNSFLPHGI